MVGHQFPAGFRRLLAFAQHHGRRRVIRQGFQSIQGPGNGEALPAPFPPAAVAFREYLPAEFLLRPRGVRFPSGDIAQQFASLAAIGIEPVRLAVLRVCRWCRRCRIRYRQNRPQLGRGLVCRLAGGGVGSWRCIRLHGFRVTRGDPQEFRQLARRVELRAAVNECHQGNQVPALVVGREVGPHTGLAAGQVDFQRFAGVAVAVAYLPFRPGLLAGGQPVQTNSLDLFQGAGSDLFEVELFAFHSRPRLTMALAIM